MVLLIVRRQLAHPRIASATTPESRMFAGDLTILWVPLLLCLQAPMTPRIPAAPLSTRFISGEPSAACPPPFSVEKWTTVDPGRERLGELSASPSTLESSCTTTASRFSFEGHIEDGYAERGAVEPRYSGLMQSIGLTPAVLKCSRALVIQRG